MRAAKRPTPIKAPKTPPPIAPEFDFELLEAELVDGRGAMVEVGVCVVAVCITTFVEGVGVSCGFENTLGPLL